MKQERFKPGDICHLINPETHFTNNQATKDYLQNEIDLAKRNDYWDLAAEGKEILNELTNYQEGTGFTIKHLYLKYRLSLIKEYSILLSVEMNLMILKYKLFEISSTQ